MYASLVTHLVEAVREVPLDHNEADQHVYLVFNDLMRFVSSSIDAGDTEEHP